MVWYVLFAILLFILLYLNVYEKKICIRAGGGILSYTITSVIRIIFL